MSDDLAAFLRARFDDDVRGVQEWIRPEPPDFLLTSSLRPVHEWVDRAGAARVLAEVQAKRRIVELWEDPAEVETFPEGLYDGRDPDEVETQVAVAETIDHILRLLALSYADHPDYRPEEWKP